MSRRSFILSAPAAAIGCVPFARARAARAEEPTLEVVLARHTRARGGAEALDSVRSLLSIGEVAEPGFTVIGRYIAHTDGLMRVDVFADGQRVFSEGIDASGAWSWPGDASAPAQASAQGRAALAHGIEFNLFGLHAYERRGHQVRLRGRQTLHGVDYFELAIRLSDGFETTFFVDPESWLAVLRRDRRPLHPDVDPTPVVIETEYSDFRTVQGVVSPFRTVDRNVETGEVLQRGTVRALDHNVPASLLNFPRDVTVIPPET